MELSKLKYTKRRLEILKQLNINSVEEVLSYYPYRYDYLSITPYRDFKVGMRVIFKGRISRTASTFRYGKKAITHFNVVIEDEHELSLTIFNRPWAKSLNIEKEILCIGIYKGDGKVTLTNYYDKDPDDVLGIVPLYPLKSGITQNDIKKIIAFTLKNMTTIDDGLPFEYENKHGLITYEEALRAIHVPSDIESLKKALARLKYSEFLAFYVALLSIRDKTKIKRQVKNFDLKIIEDFIRGLSFELTKDQHKAIDEILDDLKGPTPMYRLLEGDVGSGKTIVATIALLANYLKGYMGVIMAPTEILASQHYDSIQKDLAKFGIKVALLTSSTKEREELLKQIKKGAIDILVGTHALYSDDVIYQNLGLVIADEQQRFGVLQRRKLLEKGKEVDFLLMSATPIPRTLASALYGDMDISAIMTLPKGRKKVITKLYKSDDLFLIKGAIEALLKKGQKIYIVAPAIEENEDFKAISIAEIKAMVEKYFSSQKYAVLHGRLKSAEKESVMNDFVRGDTKILIATTVVEVGVNVSSATAMIIMDAEHFGLSQLHQLRGRIKRSSHQGYCFLMTSSKDERALKRLEVLVKSDDGFMIAKADLMLRGMGDMFGIRQSGLPSFVLGDIFKDQKIMSAAKKDAEEILLKLDEYQEYIDKILKRSASFIA